MNWQQVIENPHLKDLPFKIETNEWGQIVMTRARAQHGVFQSRITNLLYSLTTNGVIIDECAIQTSQGTKVADVAWVSDGRWEQIADDYDATIAPEICVEVLSPGNTIEEMEEKRHLYAEAGALEVWVCDNKGNMQFFVQDKAARSSTLVPTFPHRITLRRNDP